MNSYIVGRNRGLMRFGVFSKSDYDMVASIIKPPIEFDRKIRREIANSNERRRMQSINAGFDALRLLLPSIPDGEKMSKASILQLTSKYIQSLIDRIHYLECELELIRTSRQIPKLSNGIIEVNSLNIKQMEKKSNDALINRKRTVDNKSSISLSKIEIVPPKRLSTESSRVTINKNEETTKVVEKNDVPVNDFSSSRLEHLVMAIQEIEGVEESNKQTVPTNSFSTCLSSSSDSTQLIEQDEHNFS